MRGARLPFRTTTAMGLTTRAEDERGGDRRAAGRRSVGIPERAARSRTRNEANGKTTAADQYRRTRRRARCDRTVRGASSWSPMCLLIIVSSPPSPTCARRPGLRRERGPLRLLPRPHDAPALPWRCLAPRTFRAGCADSAPRPATAAGGRKRRWEWGVWGSWPQQSTCPCRRTARTAPSTLGEYDPPRHVSYAALTARWFGQRNSCGRSGKSSAGPRASALAIGWRIRSVAIAVR
jgi:hypothetical protein